jgi:NADPH:quinone reductase-like Zn-dependent oxidoreductase
LQSGASSILDRGTAAAACSIFLELDRPNLKAPSSPKSEKILIYGGSSSCGALAITYATAAGYEVITTSSSKNHEFVSSLGPAAVVDHTQPASKIIQDIEKHGPYREILDTIGVPSVTDIMIRYLSLVDRGTYFTLIPNFNTANLFQRTLTLASSHTYGSWKIRDTKSVGSVSTALWSLKDLLP